MKNQKIAALFFLLSSLGVNVNASAVKSISVTVPGYVTCGVLKMDRGTTSEIPDRLVFVDWSKPNPVPIPFGMLWSSYRIGNLSGDALKTKDDVLEKIFFTENAKGELALNEKVAKEGVVVKAVYVGSSRLISKDEEYMYLTPNVLVPSQFITIEKIDAASCKKMLGLSMQPKI